LKIIVVAGGQGTKLWPYSRKDKPKQFQPIIDEKSVYADCVETLLQKFAPEDVYISTKRKFIKFVSEQTPQIPLKNYIIEPDVAKDRGPGEGLAFLKLSLLHPGEPIFLVQSDVLRKPDEAFLQMIEEAGKIVERDKVYVTGGIKATEADMGVDYLKLGEKVPGASLNIYKLDEFLDRKGSYRETKELIENFNVVTHCNHLCWYPEMVLEAYRQYRPDWYEALMQIKDVLDQPGEDAAIEAIYETMEKGSTEEVTKHVMQSGNACVVLLPFEWTDFGTWGSVYEYYIDGDGSENYADCKNVTVDVGGSLIKSSHPNKLVAIAGVEDLVVVDTDDVLLIIPKNKIEKIKDIQKLLEERGETEYL
jgi:mannose-1-phosphate guanylyltransferase